MLSHPRIGVAKGERVTAGRVVRQRGCLWMLLPPVDPQPRGKAKIVVCLLRTEEREVLVVPDELFQGRPVDDLGGGKLLLDRRPLRV